MGNLGTIVALSIPFRAVADDAVGHEHALPAAEDVSRARQGVRELALREQAVPRA